MIIQINDFLTGRKTAWLKAKSKPNLDDDTLAALRLEADIKFSLSVWLPDAAKRVGQLNMVSHPSKFSHPSAKTSTVIANGSYGMDGYLRSGNVSYALDVFGNAAALDVYKFLSLTLDDGKTILTHLEDDSNALKSIFNFNDAPYSTLRQQLLKIKQTSNASVTDTRVKQVYFPIGRTDDYHLLSILTPSGLLSKIKNTIDALRFSEAAKIARKNHYENKMHDDDFDDIYNLTITAYGGTQPQNISVLNSQNAGRAYLLASSPPVLIKRDTRLPHTDFFKNSLWLDAFKSHFIKLHAVVISWKNNMHIRADRDDILTAIIDEVIKKAFSIRLSREDNWTNEAHYQGLPLYQKIWLDQTRQAERDADDVWLDDLTNQLARWILDGYEYSMKRNAIDLGDGELRHVSGMVKQYIQEDREYLR